MAKTAICRAICNARSRYVHGIGKSSFLVLLWNINLYMISPRRQTKSEKWNLWFISTISTLGIPTSGINYLENRTKKKSERNQITIIIHFSIIILYSVNLERSVVFSIWALFRRFSCFPLVLTHFRSFPSNNFIKFQLWERVNCTFFSFLNQIKYVKMYDIIAKDIYTERTLKILSYREK